jgi:hypothetical protein
LTLDTYGNCVDLSDEGGDGKDIVFRGQNMDERSVDAIFQSKYLHMNTSESSLGHCYFG